MEVVQCDRCKSVVARNTISKFSYRSNESIRDIHYGTTIDLDICENCISEMQAWIKPMEIAAGIREESEDD